MPSLFTCLIFYHFQKQKSTSPPKRPAVGSSGCLLGPFRAFLVYFPTPDAFRASKDLLARRSLLAGGYCLIRIPFEGVRG